MRIVEAGEGIQRAVHLQQRLAEPGGQPALQVRGQRLGTAVEQLAQELVPSRLFRCYGGDLPALEVGQFGGRLEGVVEVAELVHQPQLLGILPGPDPAFGGFLRLFRAQATALAHQADEALVGVFHAELDGLAYVFRQGPGQADPHEVRGADAVGVHPILGECLLDGGEHAEHPDGAREGGGGGEDLVRVGGDPVAPRGGVAAHGDDHRLARLLQGQQLGADLLGGEGAAPRAVDPQYHGLHLVVAAGLGQQIGEAVAAYGAGGLNPVHDGTAGEDQTHLILAALGILLRNGGQILFQTHPFPAVILGLAHFLDHRLGHLVTGGELVHQTVVEGVVGGIATGLAQQFEEAVLVRRDGIGLDLPLLGHVGHIGLP